MAVPAKRGRRAGWRPAGYRHDIEHYIVPRIGRMRLQALRPAVISKFYGDLTKHGGRDGRALSATTVSHIHRTLRKALADAVDVEQLLAANPAARSKRPRNTAAEPVQVWTGDQLGTFLATARSHRLFAFYRLAAYTGARRGELLYLRWEAINIDTAEVTFGGSTICRQWVESCKGRPVTIGWTRHGGCPPRKHRRQQTEERLTPVGVGDNDGRSSQPMGENRSTRHRGRAHDQADQPARKSAAP
jgi:integrase